ncbi:hypothetical protein JZ751_025417 [Albula glossodonta]|uniref:Uncharacterized protein n=1 Tax=Albula glossodonta TaxID=121402 RepID=A0A8T2MQN3_9TELE|nr:hypothetical protein JZ751_025417 [Albula glossodonta]
MFNSQKIQARHYRPHQEMYKTKKRNKAAVTHLLDLGFESRRHFIASDAVKGQDRPTEILEAYPCFKEVDHAMDELQRIIQPTNVQYICEMKDRWKTFYSQVQFYGVMKKAMNPPRALNGERKRRTRKKGGKRGLGGEECELSLDAPASSCQVDQGDYKGVNYRFRPYSAALGGVE